MRLAAVAAAVGSVRLLVHPITDALVAVVAVAAADLVAVPTTPFSPGPTW